MKLLKRYKLIKEYPNSPKLGTIIEECYSVPGQFVNQQSPKRECYTGSFKPEYWQRLKDKKTIIYD